MNMKALRNALRTTGLALAALAAPTLLALVQAPAGATPQVQPLPREAHLANIRQLTDGGQNAEAYFSFDGKKLIYQGYSAPGGCDQIYTMNADGTSKRLVSTGKGRCTCAYFTKDGNHILFSSTHEAGAECPLKPDHAQGYVWPVYDSYKIYFGDADGKHLKRLTPQEAYNAEATLSPDGTKLVWASNRNARVEHETNIFIADWVDSPKAVAPATLAVSAETVKRDVYYLASDDMKGRLTGSPEGQRAARYRGSVQGLGP